MFFMQNWRQIEVKMMRDIRLNADAPTIHIWSSSCKSARSENFSIYKKDWIELYALQ